MRSIYLVFFRSIVRPMHYFSQDLELGYTSRTTSICQIIRRKLNDEEGTDPSLVGITPFHGSRDETALSLVLWLGSRRRLAALRRIPRALLEITPIFELKFHCYSIKILFRLAISPAMRSGALSYSQTTLICLL